jgi:hypothetical protein
MTNPATDTLIAPQEEKVLSTAVARAADLWKLTNDSLAQILGVSSATASRLRSGAWQLERGTKPFELGQYLVRLFRSLDALMGSDDEASMSWLRADNLDLGGRPIDLIRTVRGLGETTDYLDAFRART